MEFYLGSGLSFETVQKQSLSSCRRLQRVYVFITADLHTHCLLFTVYERGDEDRVSNYIIQLQKISVATLIKNLMF